MPAPAEVDQATPPLSASQAFADHYFDLDELLSHRRIVEQRVSMLTSTDTEVSQSPVSLVMRSEI